MGTGHYNVYFGTKTLAFCSWQNVHRPNRIDHKFISSLINLFTYWEVVLKEIVVGVVEEAHVVVVGEEVEAGLASSTGHGSEI